MAGRRRQGTNRPDSNNVCYALSLTICSAPDIMQSSKLLACEDPSMHVESPEENDDHVHVQQLFAAHTALDSGNVKKYMNSWHPSVNTLVLGTSSVPSRFR